MKTRNLYRTTGKEETVSEQKEALSVNELGRTIEELVSSGCKFVLEGSVFSAINELIEKLLLDGNPDKEGEAFLLSLRGALLGTSKPVRARLGFSDDNNSRIKIVQSLPGLPTGAPKIQNKH